MISPDMKIIDLVNEYPEAISILQKHGIGCMGCMLAHSETIAEGLAAHGMDVEAVLKEIEAASEAASVETA